MSLVGLVSAETYVIGGFVVAPHSEPHIISLQKTNHFCGATVISATHGICAAHCYYEPSIVTAVVGAHNILRNESSQVRAPLSEFRKHPEYNSKNVQNDVATLKFKRALTLNEYVQPLCPPVAQEAEWMPEGATIHVCGWGNTQIIGRNYPAELHCVNTKYVPKEICNSRESYEGVVLDGMFCAGDYGTG